MKGKYFLDTNIFIYTFDNKEPEKQQKSQQLIQETLRTRKGIISYQIIQEFVNASLQKFSVSMEPEHCKSYIDNFLYPLCEIFPSSELFKEAIDIKRETGLSYFDSLIVISAIKGNCKILYTEDMNDGQVIRGIKISNPFHKIKNKS